MPVDPSLLITGPLFVLSYVFVQFTSLIISLSLAPFYLLAGARYFVLMIRQKLFDGAPNRSTLPGTPTLAWPQYFPLAGTAKSSWFVGLLWVLQWESMLEIMMIETILPILLIPLQTIFGNVVEELLSWIGGNGDPRSPDARESLPNIFGEPMKFIYFVMVRVPHRVAASLGRMVKWLGGESITNHNHAVANYVQGLDFSISAEDVQDFCNPDLARPARLKATAWVLTKAALMSYERLHVFEGILDRDWNPPHGTPVSPGADPSAEYASKLLCAWQFDEITSADPALSDHQSTLGKTTAFLVSIELAALAKAPQQKALILVFRGTEIFENLEWFTNFATAPPQEDPPDGAPQPYGQVHQGFERALGLGSVSTTLQPAKDVLISYILYQNSQATRMPDPSELTWPPTLVGDSPYGIISRKIIDVMKDEPAYKLYVSGHSLGAALANLFTAALLIPPQSPWNAAGFAPDRYAALCTQGQPRLGTYAYNQALEKALRETGNPAAYKFIRLVNADCIVCRVPPLQVTLPPFFPVTGMWEHPGHLFFLPVKHISFVQTAKAVALKMEQPWLQRLWPDNNEQMSTLQPQADVLPMFEQPVSFRNSLFWNSVRRALFCTWRYCFEGGEGNATLLRLIVNWFVVVTVFPLGVLLLLVPLQFAIGLGLILFSVLIAGPGIMEGVSDHGLDGYLNAIAASSPDQWVLSRARRYLTSASDHRAANGILTQ